MVKKRGLVWTYYNKKVNGTTVIAFCKFCNRSYIQNATRMEKHLARCEKATPEVKQLFLRVSTSKRVNRARLLGAKIGGNWMKSNGDVTLDISSLTEADLEDINQCMRNEKQEAVNEEEAPVQAIDMLADEDEEIAWAADQDIEKSSNLNINGTKPIRKVWIRRDEGMETNDNYVINVMTQNLEKTHGMASSGRKETKSVPKITFHNSFKNTLEQPRTFRQSIESEKSPAIESFSPNSRIAGHSPLQTKILQEQLLERRALRKLAELEMRRKTIEFERLQWEYERDKTRADIRWEHETRMMHLREERAQKLLHEASTSSPSPDTKILP